MEREELLQELIQAFNASKGRRSPRTQEQTPALILQLGTFDRESRAAGGNSKGRPPRKLQLGIRREGEATTTATSKTTGAVPRCEITIATFAGRAEQQGEELEE